MRKLILSLFLVFLQSGETSRANTSPEAQKILTKRFVEIEFEKAPDAISYELEVYNHITKKFLKSFFSKTQLFKLNVKLGKYLIRSRFTDRFGRTSPWSDLNEMMIAPPPTAFQGLAGEKAINKVEANKKTNKFSTTLQWKPMVNIENYMVWAETPEGEKIAEFKTQKPSLNLALQPGLYRFKVMAILPDGSLGDPSEPSQIFDIAGSKIPPPRLFYRKPNPLLQSPDQKADRKVSVRSPLKSGELDGYLEYQAWESETWQQVKKIENVRLTDAKIEGFELDPSLRPGKYKLTLRVLAKKYTPSDYATIDFVLKPRKADLDSIKEEIKLALNGIDPATKPAYNPKENRDEKALLPPSEKPTGESNSVDGKNKKE